MSANSLAHADPLDQALIELLTTIPSTWTPSRYEELSRTEQDAIQRVVLSGVVEARIEVDVTLDGFHHRLWGRFRVTGDWWEVVELELGRRFPPEWPAKDDCGKVKPCWKISPFQEVRLTTEGERRKEAWVGGDSQDRMNVLVVLRGNSFCPPFRAPADVKVEDSKVWTTGASGQNITAAQAIAHASIGDVIVNNQINVPAPEVVVQVNPAEFAHAGTNDMTPEDDRQADTKNETPSATRIVFCGDGLYENSADEPFRLEGQEAIVLEALVELRAATKQLLVDHSGVQDAVNILKQIDRKHQFFSRAIQFPGGRGRGGYRTFIQPRSGE